jgi:hypothetical protein
MLRGFVGKDLERVLLIQLGISRRKNQFKIVSLATLTHKELETVSGRLKFKSHSLTSSSKIN